MSIYFLDRAVYHNRDENEWVGNRSYNNTLVAFDVTLSGDKSLTLAEWQAVDSKINDVGATYINAKISEKSDEIIRAARDLLQI